MVNKAGYLFHLLAMFCLCSFAAAATGVEEVPALKNGYSDVPKESMALLDVAQVPATREIDVVEQPGSLEESTSLETSDFPEVPEAVETIETLAVSIDAEHQVPEAAALASPARVSGMVTTPTDATAEIAAAWTEEYDLAYCRGPRMQLGYKANDLFDKVSITFFDNAPFSKSSSTRQVVEAEKNNRKDTLTAIVPVKEKSVVKKEAMSESAVKKGINEVPVKIQPKPTVTKRTEKKLYPMPKIVEGVNAKEEMLADNERPWPEEIHAPIKKTTVVEAEQSLNAPLNGYQNVSAKTPDIKKPDTDCDRGGNKIARGRLAWMECYYRMGN